MDSNSNFAILKKGNFHSVTAAILRRTNNNNKTAAGNWQAFSKCNTPQAPPPHASVDAQKSVLSTIPKRLFTFVHILVEKLDKESVNNMDNSIGSWNISFHNVIKAGAGSDLDGAINVILDELDLLATGS